MTTSRPNAIGICMYAPTADGGHARYVWEVMTALASHAEHAHRTRCELVTSIDLDPQFRSDQYPVHPILPPLRHRASYASPLTWAASRVTHYLRREGTFVRWLRRRPDIQLVHLQEWAFWLLPLLVGRVRAQGKRVVATVHNVLPHKYPRLLPKAWVDHMIRSGCRRCDGLLVHTEALAAQLADFVGTPHPPIHVAPHGVWTVDRSPVPPLTQRLARKRLLFFGCIRRNKGLDLLLRAAAELKDYTITIAGEPLEGAYYQSQIVPLVRDLSAQGIKIELEARFIAEDEIPALFQSHSAIVLPYTPAFVAQSGVVFMALAHALPVVTSEAGGLAELMREFEIGVTFHPATPTALAAAVRRLHDDGGVAHLARAMRAAREKHSWSNNARATLRCYRNVLEPLTEMNDDVVETTPVC